MDVSSLRDHIMANDLEFLKQAITNKSHIFTQKDKEDLVKLASEHGHPECLQLLVDSRFPVSCDWDSPVTLAAGNGEIPVILRLHFSFTVSFLSYFEFNIIQFWKKISHL